jgi:hypothetical protein
MPSLPVGMHGDADVAHIVARDLPGEREAIGEAVRHPVGGELGRQEQVQRPGLLAEAAQLDRLDPLAIELLTDILAQAVADVCPVGGKIHGFLIFVHLSATPCPP